jgi:hypothetical protein
VKWKGVFGTDVEVSGLPRGRLTIDEGPLQAELAGYRRGALDRAGRSNVRITGEARDGAQGRTVHVTAVDKLEDDGPLHARLVAQARTSDEAIHHARAARSLGVGDATIAPLASRILLGLTEDRARIEKVLADELQAVERPAGHWGSRAALRASFGFVARATATGTEWVRRERVELDQAIARHEREGSPELRTLMNRQYETAAREKRITTGMHRAEVVSCAGWPRAVERTERAGLTWDAWTLADGRRVHFRAGFVLGVLAPDVAR